MSTHWKWIRYEGSTLYDIGVNPDESLHNPHGYPPATVRDACAFAQQKRSERASAAARKAAETRRARKEKRVYEAARQIAAGGVYGPAKRCFICGRSLDDPQSIQRGIGSDCWQGVLCLLELLSPPGKGEGRPRQEAAPRSGTSAGNMVAGGADNAGQPADFRADNCGHYVEPGGGVFLCDGRWVCADCAGES